MSDPTDVQIASLQLLAEVKWQLASISLLIQNCLSATHQRIDDLRKTVEDRFTGIEERLGRVEENERKTAMRAASVGALAGAVVPAGIELLRFKG